MQIKIVLASLVGAAAIQIVATDCSSSTASAGAADFEVAPETCDKSYTFDEPGGPGPTTTTVFYAEHAYPGKTRDEIAAHVRHWTAVTPQSRRPAGYEIEGQSVIFTRDGFAGAGCKQGSTTYFFWH